FCETIIDAIDVRVRVTEVLRDQQESMKEIKRANNDALINKTDTYLMISAALGVMAVIVLVAAPSFVAIIQGLSQTAGR
ncbi:MAG: hypothetical protein Q7U75_14780, partial [Desulfobacterales bacterium]|nr:hypothetical protein [Desulfobacterales bacterium]